MTPAALEEAAPGQGQAVMRSAVGLATSAAERHAGAVALSLGSFGSTLKPGQEYAGVYPPPFGPSPSVCESSPQPAGTAGGQLASSVDTGAGTTTQQHTACASSKEEALYAFHLERLRAYRDATSTKFGGLAWLAFETVPNLAEIQAIRRAMATLRNEGQSGADSSRGEERGELEHAERQSKAQTERQISSKGIDARPRGEGSEARAEVWGGATDLSSGASVPHKDTEDTSRDSAAGGPTQPKFWICSAFPSGQLGQAPNGPHAVAEWVAAMTEGGPEYATPDGVGVNCTNPSYLPAILDEIEARIPASVRARTTLVVYPDGGCVYDPITKDWTEKTGTPDEWARGVLDVLKGREWQGIIVGGCCKTGPEEIAALRKAVDAS